MRAAEKYIDDIDIDLDDSWTVLTQFNSGSLILMINMYGKKLERTYMII